VEPRTIRSFRDLVVWQKARALALDVYRVTNNFPDTERDGVVAQMRRSAVSVPVNIAEGFGQRTTREFERLEGECDSVAQMLNALAGVLRDRSARIKSHEPRTTSHSPGQTE
jgi:hypothetical protein